MPHEQVRVVVTNAVLCNAGDAAILLGIRAALAGNAGSTRLGLVVHDSLAASSRRVYPELEIRQQCTIVATGTGRWRRAFGRTLRLLTCSAMVHCATARRLVVWLSASLCSHFEFFRAIRDLALADVVISSGGTYFVDGYKFGQRVLTLRLAESLGKPVLLWTQSLGPFSSARAKRQIAKLDGVISAAFFRDRPSLERWQSVLPLPPTAEVCPDAAFGLYSYSGPAGATNGDDIGQEILVSVREWHRPVSASAVDVMEAYSDSLRSAVDSLLRSGRSVTALSTCQGICRYPSDDARIAKTILGSLDVTIQRSHHAPFALMTRLAESHALVATRMHMAILALETRTPVLAIAYEFKTVELFRSLGLHDDVINIEDLTRSRLSTRLAKVLDQRPLLSDEHLRKLAREAMASAVGAIRLAEAG